MRVWLFEWKKILYYQKAGIIILAYLLGIFVNLAVTDAPVSYGMDKNRESYEYYLRQVTGAVNEKTKSFFEEQSSTFGKADSEIQTIYRKFSKGEFSEDEYRRKLSELKEIIKKKQGFTVLFDQYSYVRENTKNRYLLNTNAWDAMLSNDSLNIPLVLVIMLVALLVFGVEYTSEMDCLIRMSKKGERETAGMKIAIMVLLSLLLCLLDYVVRILYFQYRYGFTHGDYPIQSLRFFADFTEEYSLYKVMGHLLCWRLLGAVLWGCIISALIVLTKKYALSMLWGISGIVLATYALPEEYMKYYLPGPVGALAGSGYFRGTAYHHDTMTGEESLTFLQVSMEMKRVIFFTNVVLIVVLVFFILHQYNNCWNPKKACKKLLGRRTVSIVLVFNFLLLTGGCRNMNDNQIFNVWQNTYYESKNYLVYAVSEDAEHADFVVENKATGEKMPLVRDAFSDSKMIYPCIYGKGDDVYYLEMAYANEEQLMSREFDRVSIVCVNLNDFSSSVIYQDDQLLVENKSMFGLYTVRNKFLDMYIGTSGFIVDDNQIYFITATEVWSISRISRKRKLLFYIQAPSVSYDGEGFYFIDDMFQLMRYELDTEETIPVEKIVTDSFVQSDEGLIYKDLEQDGKMMYLNLASHTKSLIWEGTPYGFVTDGQNIFYLDESNNFIYEQNPKDGRRKSLGKANSTTLYVFQDYDKVYAVDPASGEIKIYKK